MVKWYSKIVRALEQQALVVWLRLLSNKKARMPYYKKEYMIGGADIFLDWLSRQAKALPVLQRAHVSKGYFYPLFVIPCQIFIQYVNEFLDAYSCPVPVVKHLVFQTAKQTFTGRIVRGASLF